MPHGGSLSRKSPPVLVHPVTENATNGGKVKESSGNNGVGWGGGEKKRYKGGGEGVGCWLL